MVTYALWLTCFFMSQIKDEHIAKDEPIEKDHLVANKFSAKLYLCSP